MQRADIIFGYNFFKADDFSGLLAPQEVPSWDGGLAKK